MGKHGYTGYIGVYRVYSISRVNNTGYRRVYRLYNMTKVNMGTQDIKGFTGFTVLLG